MGDAREVNGVLYTKRDRAALDALVAATPTDEVELARSCTTGVTDLAELFGEAGGTKVSDPTTFNPDLSSWDTSSVTDMSDMFFVRVPPSRVLLLLLHRCVVLVARPPSSRSEIAVHSTRLPVPRCAVVCQCLRSGHQ